MKLGTEHAQPGYREGQNDVIDLTHDEGVMSALESAYFPAMELRSATDERRKAEVFQLTEEFQKRVRTMEEVFDKAGAPDRPGEVGITDLFRIAVDGDKTASLSLLYWASITRCFSNLSEEFGFRSYAHVVIDAGPAGT